MDSAVESFVRFVSLTLKMEAYKNRWIDADEMVVVPTLPEVTDEQVFQAGATLILAVIWQRWEGTEEQARVQGRTLRFLRDDERPKNAPAEFTHYIVEEGDDTSDWLHRIAFERVADKLAQNLMEVRAQKYVYTEPRPGLG
ncbi:hypothetical protein, partial [Corallococcus exiguus]|uniref:hypothetical protein n=1 Tax=Corallococcus exiguus TaxID=83462 RepID=UPI0015608E92